MWTIPRRDELDSESYPSETSPKQFSNAPSSSGSTSGIPDKSRLKSMSPKAPKRRASAKSLKSAAPRKKPRLQRPPAHHNSHDLLVTQDEDVPNRPLVELVIPPAARTRRQCDSTAESVTKSIRPSLPDPPPSPHRPRRTPEIDDHGIPDLPLTDLRIPTVPPSPSTNPPTEPVRHQTTVTTFPADSRRLLEMGSEQAKGKSILVEDGIPDRPLNSLVIPDCPEVCSPAAADSASGWPDSDRSDSNECTMRDLMRGRIPKTMQGQQRTGNPNDSLLVSQLISLLQAPWKYIHQKSCHYAMPTDAHLAASVSSRVFRAEVSYLHLLYFRSTHFSRNGCRRVDLATKVESERQEQQREGRITADNVIEGKSPCILNVHGSRPCSSNYAANIIRRGFLRCRNRIQSDRGHPSPITIPPLLRRNHQTIDAHYGEEGT